MDEPSHLAARPRLLGADDPAPFEILNPAGASPYLLIADHAGQRIPAALDSLGLPQNELDRHIGWDIGIAGVTRHLSAQLDAFAITQTYSRLLIDCNRPLAAAMSIPTVSDGTLIPGNQTLGPVLRQQRIDEVFAPYHSRIGAELDLRKANGDTTLLIAMHSFTPEMNGIPRPWHAGVLYQRDARLALALRQALQEDDPSLVIGDNQPYAVSDATDYAIPVHGERRGLAHVELEIRQDLIADDTDQHRWALRLAKLLQTLAPAFAAT